MAVNRIHTAVLDMKVVKRSLLEIGVVGETSSAVSVERELTDTRCPRVLLQPYGAYAVQPRQQLSQSLTHIDA